MKLKFELIYRIIFIVICSIGIGIHFDFNNRNINAHEFSFFTLWSNIFCLIVMIILLIKHFMGKDTRSKILIYFKGMALSSITCTFVIYHFSEHSILLSDNSITSLGIPIESVFAHYVIPTMFVLDWLIFQPKGLFQWHNIITWLAFPFIYILCFFTRCQCNKPEEFLNVPKYPYFFLDYECIGYGKCFLYILILMIIFLAANIIIIFFDKLLFQRMTKKHTK